MNVDVRRDLEDLRGDVRHLHGGLDRLQHELAELRHQLDVMRFDALRGEFADRVARISSRFATLLPRIELMHEELKESAMPELPRSVGLLDRMWRLANHTVPLSCSDEEGLVMYEAIVANGLTSGFEIATAFGFSTAYIAAGLQANGGSLVTMDCYVEEWKISDTYDAGDLEAGLQRTRANIARGDAPEGLAMARKIANKLDLARSVDFQVGLSPQDVPRAVAEKPIDFAFIDGGHHGEQPTEDFNAVAPFLAERCMVFFHDNYPGAVPIERAVAAAAAHLGSRATRLESRNFLTVVTRGLPLTAVEALRPLVVRSGLGLT